MTKVVAMATIVIKLHILDFDRFKISTLEKAGPFSLKTSKDILLDDIGLITTSLGFLELALTFTHDT